MKRCDQCYLLGRRAARLNPQQASEAWKNLASQLETMGELALPKYNDLLNAINAALKLSKKE